MKLELPTHLAKSYKSKSQIARVITESWVAENAYCPNCGQIYLSHFENNRPVADFFCANCREEFELKSKQTNFSTIINDGAYDTMIRRLESENNPNFFFLNYSKEMTVINFILIPKHFFTPKIIIKRKKVFAFIFIVIFFGEAIPFVLNATTNYKIYTDSKAVKAEVINVSGMKNSMLDVKYRYNYDGDKYEESVRQSVGEIKVGDKKEIRIRKNAPEQIVTTSIKSVISQSIAFVLWIFAYIPTSITLIERIG